MGHRANFVVIEGQSVEAFFDSWAAPGVLSMFAAGPSCVREVRMLEPSRELLDWAFAEGGFLVDFDRRVAIVFGTSLAELFDLEDLGADLEQLGAVELPRVPGLQGDEFSAQHYLQEVSEAWAGWRLVYDERGVDAFSSYVSEQRELAGCNVSFAEPSHPDDLPEAVTLEVLSSTED